MTVKELIDALSQYPEDVEVVYDLFEDTFDHYNFISGACAHTDENGKTMVHLYEE